MYETSQINDQATLQALYGDANPNSLAKETDRLTPVYLAWIKHAPFMAIASLGQGGLDCSPRGDKAGQLFRVLDDQTIAIPDRRGNNRLDTISNLVSDPRIALLFMLPGVNESLRINGDAMVVTDEALRTSFAAQGKLPVSVIVVKIKSVYFQCGRAMLRAQLWSSDAQVSAADVPSAGEMIKASVTDFDAERYDAKSFVRQQDTLY